MQLAFAHRALRRLAHSGDFVHRSTHGLQRACFPVLAKYQREAASLPKMEPSVRLDALEAASDGAATTIRLLMLTSCCRSEINSPRFELVDLHAGDIRVADPPVMSGAETGLTHTRVEAEVAHQALRAEEAGEVADRRHQQLDRRIVQGTLRDLAIEQAEILGNPGPTRPLSYRSLDVILRNQEN